MHADSKRYCIEPDDWAAAPLSCRPASCIPEPTTTLSLQHEKHHLIATDDQAPLGTVGASAARRGYDAVKDMRASILWTLLSGSVCVLALSTCAYLLHFSCTSNPAAGYQGVEASALLQPAALALDIIWRMPGALQGLKGSVSSAAPAAAAAGAGSASGEAGSSSTAAATADQASSSADSTSTQAAAGSDDVVDCTLATAASASSSTGASSQAEGPAGPAACTAAASSGGQAWELDAELYSMALLVGYSGDSDEHLALREACTRLASSSRPDIVQVRMQLHGCNCSSVVG